MNSSSSAKCISSGVSSLPTSARYPVPFELVPEATHWFDKDGEMSCSAIYEHSVLWSQTLILNQEDRIPRLEDFLPDTDPEP
jgi:hypothetical protein